MILIDVRILYIVSWTSLYHRSLVAPIVGRVSTIAAVEIVIAVTIKT